MQKLGHPLIVIDFDPEIIKGLRSKDINAMYGDMGDPELLDHLSLDTAKMIISTAHNFLDNLAILKKACKVNKNAITMITADSASDALLLYDEGADYVILPHHLSGVYLADLINHVRETAPKTTERAFEQKRTTHIHELHKLLQNQLG